MNYELSKVKETMTSVEIAELINKPHNDVMKAIRAMEPAWEKVCKGKFSLTSREVVQPNGGKRSLPCYELGKTECLFIATKFNDEARAMIILRWEQLEKEKANNTPAVPTTFREALLLAAEQQAQIEEQRKLIGQQQEKIENNNKEIIELTSAVASMEKKVTYLDKILECKSTVKATTIAQDYGMTATTFNKMLFKYGIQHKCGDVWVLYAKYLPQGYVKDVAFQYVKNDGTQAVKPNMQWTQKGRMFLYEFLKGKSILPLIER